MSDFITTSLTYTGKEANEWFFTPLVRDQFDFTATGVRSILDVQSTMKLDFMSAANKMTKAYVKGWTTPGSGAAYTQKSLTVADMKAEWSQDAKVFRGTMKEALIARGVKANDLDEAATELKQAILDTAMNGVGQDLERQVWLNDTSKLTYVSGTNSYNSTADTNYNAYEGFWSRIFDVTSSTPTSSQIYRKTMAHGSVAKVDTVELTTGSSGDLIIDFQGTSYTVAYGTSLTVTATLFYTTHAAALALLGITLTNPSAGILTFTATTAGFNFASPAFNTGSDITGTVTNTTANTAPSALAANEAETYLIDLYDNCNDSLKSVPINDKVFLVDYATYTNYMATLETRGTGTAFGGILTDTGLSNLVNGQPVLKFRGIAVIPMSWDTHLSADFVNGYPNRIVYMKKGNLVFGVDEAMMSIEEWYSKDDQENRYRVQYAAGTQIVHESLIAVSY